MEGVVVKLKKKRNPPIILMALKQYENQRYPLLGNKN